MQRARRVKVTVGPGVSSAPPPPLRFARLSPRRAPHTWFPFLFLIAPPAPKSPSEIKSYRLIDLSALDSPQTRRKADSGLNESGGPALEPTSLGSL